ncbi:MAG: triose-phosphate isomerase [Actinomycetota bacterium]|nr:triose-phosphate isomerase [Actinomycetota bacterium]
MTAPHKLFATWKNQVDLAQSLTLAAAAVDAATRTERLFELSVCPSMTALAPVARVCAGRVAVTAQNLGWDDTHSLTGETAASDLTDLGCRYVILGHSERRLYLGETNEMIARKLQTAFTHRLTPILCIGDTAAEHRAGRSEAAVRTQLEVLLRTYHLTGGPFLVAYEPAWAISTSEHPVDCTPQEAAERHGFIRSVVAGELGAQLAADTTLLYGGSVTADNAEAYLTQPDIDGGLVGTASQDLTSFQALITATLGTYQRAQPAAGH